MRITVIMDPDNSLASLAALGLVWDSIFHVAGGLIQSLVDELVSLKRPATDTLARFAHSLAVTDYYAGAYPALDTPTAPLKPKLRKPTFDPTKCSRRGRGGWTFDVLDPREYRPDGALMSGRDMKVVRLHLEGRWTQKEIGRQVGEARACEECGHWERRGRISGSRVGAILKRQGYK
ncbi:hypothetical protein LCGC14_2415500 [marine sediment metagenome]|uniref:Uncharacterized protein n=1 Tax=marine sediment metagenome TaxID=412755 RepID=A0A0F9BR83_9ZZZZ